MTRFAIVDLSNMFARARHVTKGDSFTKVGMAMHIVFKSLRMLNRMFDVTHVVIPTDHGSWRYAVYPAYKSRRKLERQKCTDFEREENELFQEGLRNLIEFFENGTRCTVLKRNGVEADDFVGRWIQLHPNDQHIIVSGDSDFVQLLSDNVSIYDGVQDRLLETSGVTVGLAENKPKKLPFKIDSGSGKIKLNEQVEDSEPENEWWRKALFIKIVRGDPGDSIFSSFPRVSYKPCKKDISIEQAWQDRNEKGYYWTNFMKQEWSKLIGTDDNGENLSKMVRVEDEFKINESLIDLSKQPEEVKDLMDETIVEAVQKEKPSSVGVAFMKFCSRHQLVDLSQEARDHVAYLNLPYGSDG